MRMAFERVGSGPPLVLLHGVGHRRQAWYPVLDQLAEQREVVLVDLPGHGESDPLVTEGRPMVDVLRDAFAEFLVEQGLERPHVAGNSLGGRIALEAAVAGHARTVTALSPAGFWGSRLAFAYTRQLFAVMTRLSDALAPHAPRLARTRPGRTLGFGWLTAHPT
jgi:pimeloyl-ACP methyl ester carboxylesterase